MNWSKKKEQHHKQLWPANSTEEQRKWKHKAAQKNQEPSPIPSYIQSARQFQTRGKVQAVFVTLSPACIFTLFSSFDARRAVQNSQADFFPLWVREASCRAWEMLEEHSLQAAQRVPGLKVGSVHHGIIDRWRDVPVLYSEAIPMLKVIQALESPSACITTAVNSHPEPQQGRHSDQSTPVSPGC